MSASYKVIFGVPGGGLVEATYSSPAEARAALRWWEQRLPWMMANLDEPVLPPRRVLTEPEFWECVDADFDRLDEQDNPAVRYAVRRIDDPEHMAGPVVGHVEVPGAVDLMRARRAAVASGLVHDPEAFIVCEAVEA